jgi:hypothetical protein
MFDRFESNTEATTCTRMRGGETLRMFRQMAQGADPAGLPGKDMASVVRWGPPEDDTILQP